MSMWVNKNSKHLYTLEVRQQFFDVPSEFPPEMEQRIVEAQRIVHELSDYLGRVYDAHKEKRKWDTVEVPAWLVVEGLNEEPPVKQDDVQVSNSLLNRLRVKRGTF